MNYESIDILTIAFVMSNLAGALILWTAIKNTKVTRILLAVLFGWASWTNYRTANSSPKVYLEYSKESLAFYSEFINGWFSNHITLFVSAIAIGQGLIALGMLWRANGVRLACWGAILFLMSIAPLGLYAAFPFSISVAIAAWVIIRKDDKDFLLKGLHRYAK